MFAKSLALAANAFMGPTMFYPLLLRVFRGLSVVALTHIGTAAWASEPVQDSVDEEQAPVTLSAAELFAFADSARNSGDLATAEKAYRALVENPDAEIRSEARFRLGMLLSALGRNSDAALQFRAILDEKPDAQRVRLELARVLAQMGDLAAARRELRAAQAGELPPEVAQIVDRFSAALRANKPFGASFQVALAPDSNINRATRSDTLGTIIGDFTLSEDAKARSGIGLSLDGQAYFRTGIDRNAQLLARVSASGDLYRDNDFNDFSLGVQAGPEIASGQDRINLTGGIAWRWFGGTHYTTVVSTQIDIAHPLTRTAQLRGRVGVGFIDNRRNALESGESYSLSLGYERALSNRAGLSLNVAGFSQAAADPGYSTASGQAAIGGYREIGRVTLAGSLSYSHLEADKRLFLYPRRRSDDQYRATLGATFRKLTVAGFAPVVKLSVECNRSSIEIYDYRRLAAEFGIARAF